MPDDEATPAAPSLPIVLGTPAALVQADVSKSSSVRAGECWTVRIRGTAAEVREAEREYRPGATTYPHDCADWFGDAGVRVDTADMTGAEGGMAELVVRYVRRNAKEGDVSPDGVIARDVQFQTYERQETLEHFLARTWTVTLDLALLDAWRDEPDPALKAAFKVNTGGAAPEELSDMTLRAAQRIALGIEYVSMQQAQIVVEELRATRPEGVDLTPNVIVGYSLPENHRPDFGAGPTGNYHWMRKFVVVETPAPCRWLVRTVYIGVPEEFMPPDPKPDDWGDWAFDGLLYKTEVRE